MDRTSRWIVHFMIGMMLIILFLTGCASGPSAEPPACRGAAFPINPPSSFAPTSHMAEQK